MRKILFVAAILGAAPAFAGESSDTADKIGGARIEVRAGIERPNLSDTQSGTTYVDTLGSGLTYGGEVGYDIPVGKSFTVGPYVGIDAGGADKCETYTDVGINGTACFKSNTNLTAGVRVAYATPKTELYLGLGYDSYNVDFSIREVSNPGGLPVFSYDKNGSRGGLDVSLGANFTVSKHAYIGLGMKVGEMGDFENTGFNLQRFQGHVALGMRF